MADGSWLELTCSTQGQSVVGNWGATTLWYLTTSGGYASGSFIHTGTNSAVVPACDQPGNGSSSAIPVARASTGGYPLNVRSGPSTANSVIGTQPDGSWVELSCSITAAISGTWGTTTLW